MPSPGETAAPKAAGFYEEALTEAERLRLPRAQGVKGIDDEIALLRVRLLGYAEKNPEKLEMLMQGVGTADACGGGPLSPFAQVAAGPDGEHRRSRWRALGRGMGVGDYGAEGRDDGV